MNSFGTEQEHIVQSCCYCSPIANTATQSNISIQLNFFLIKNKIFNRENKTYKNHCPQNRLLPCFYIIVCHNEISELQSKLKTSQMYFPYRNNQSENSSVFINGALCGNFARTSSAEILCMHFRNREMDFGKMTKGGPNCLGYCLHVPRYKERCP